jgi:Ricin-type beta-trefoil lectin domain-like
MRLRTEVRRIGRGLASRPLMAVLASAGLLGGLSLTAAAAPAANAAATVAGHGGTAPGLAGFTIQRVAAIGARFSLQNVHSEKCITSDGKDNHAAEVYSCNGDSNQTWHLGGKFNGYYQLRNDATNQCLGIAGGSRSNGADVVVWKCLGTGHTDQYWTYFNANGTTEAWAWQDFNSQEVMQIKNNSDANWATVVQDPYDDLASPNQYWWPSS